MLRPMAAYYTSQAYDAPATLIWSILTDFTSWPHWFPNVSSVDLENGSLRKTGFTTLLNGQNLYRYSYVIPTEYNVSVRVRF